ncbi:lipase family protein [Pelomyxa schiedti]|nr:lipase family protein [Pelomyxa schiedti]
MKFGWGCLLLVSFVLLFGCGVNGEVVLDMGEAYSTLYYAFSAFCVPDILATWNCTACQHNPYFQLDTVVSDKETGTYGYVGYDPVNLTVVAAYRGSWNIRNDIIDIDVMMNYDYEDMPDAGVHSGFYAGWLALKDQVVQAVNRLLSNHTDTKRVLCTGHSLGAALSGFTAVHLRNILPSTIEVEMKNFGMPRIGDADFAFGVTTMLPSSWRMVHLCDMVPHVPLDVRFHHVPTEIWEYDVGLYKVCDLTGEDPTCADSIPPLQWSPDDHMVYMDVPVDCCGPCKD